MQFLLEVMKFLVHVRGLSMQPAAIVVLFAAAETPGQLARLVTQVAVFLPHMPVCAVGFLVREIRRRHERLHSDYASFFSG